MEVKSRHHLRSDRVGDVESTLAEALGVEINGDSYELVEFEEDEYDLVLVDGAPAVVYVDDDPFLTVRGLNDHPRPVGSSPSTPAPSASSPTAPT